MKPSYLLVLLILLVPLVSCSKQNIEIRSVVIVATFDEHNVVGTFGKAVEIIPKTTVRFADGSTVILEGIRGSVGDTITVHRNSCDSFSWWD